MRGRPSEKTAVSSICGIQTLAGTHHNSPQPASTVGAQMSIV